MWLSISARFKLKGQPKDYRGLVSENWTFAGERSLSMSDLAIRVLSVIFSWHCRLLAVPDLKAEAEKIGAWLQTVHFEEVEKGDSRGSAV